MTEINNQGRLMLADALIAFLETSDDPRAPAAVKHYRSQRAQLIIRIEAEQEAGQKKEVKPGEAQVIKLKPLNLAAKRWRTNG